MELRDKKRKDIVLNKIYEIWFNFDIKFRTNYHSYRFDSPKMYSSMLRKYQVLFWCVTLHYHTEWVNEKFLYKHFDGLLLPKLNVNCNYLKYKGTKKLNCVRICTHCKRLHVYKHFWKILLWKKRLNKRN